MTLFSCTCSAMRRLHIDQGFRSWGLGLCDYLGKESARRYARHDGLKSAGLD